GRPHRNIAMGPTVIMATFSVMFFAYGMDIWFSERVRTAVKDSQQVAQAYVREHQESVGYETVGIAIDLRREGPLRDAKRDRIERVMTAQGRARLLDEAAIIDAKRQVLAAADLTILTPLDLAIPDEKFEAARRSDATILSSPTPDPTRPVAH